MLTGDNSLIQKAVEARDASRGGQVKEYVDLAALSNEQSTFSGGEKTNKEGAIADLYSKGELTDEDVQWLKTNDIITIGGITIDFSILNDTENEDTEAGKTGTNVTDKTRYSKISVNGLKFADIDGDDEADGIIVADLTVDPSTYPGGNPWGDEYGSFSYTQETTGLREYEENNDYTYTFGGSNVSGTLVKCTNTSGKQRYYILALSDMDRYTSPGRNPWGDGYGFGGSDYYWYYNASGLDNIINYDVNDFGEGKKNTDTMFEKWKSKAYGPQSYNDIWGHITAQVKAGWFVPSKSEWAAFASYLGGSSYHFDEKYGLEVINGFYWTSSQCDTNSAYYIALDRNQVDGSRHGFYGQCSGCVRLASTF